MPAYFSVYFEIKKAKTKTAIQDFYDALTRSGLVFCGGCYESKADSLDEIIKWNQSRLDQDFQLGFTENFSHGYKDAMFRFESDNSLEISAGVENWKGAPTFSFVFLIEEESLLEYVDANNKYVLSRKTERMSAIKSLAISLWRLLKIEAVQTMWELSDCPPSARNFSMALKPQFEPFCIIKNSSLAKELQLPFEEIGNEGILIEDDENWLPVDFTDLIPLN